MTPEAEVDLVALDGDVLVCVEVKTGRAGPRYRPGHRVDFRRLERLRAAARRLGRQSRRRHRVDVLEVLLDADGVYRSVAHHRDVRRPIG